MTYFHLMILRLDFTPMRVEVSGPRHLDSGKLMWKIM